MTTLPDGLTRYTGANTFSAEDAFGNVFYAFQKQNDAGSVVMVRPDGSQKEVLSIPGGGRPSLDCNANVGLWAVGNKEVPSNQAPPRYPVKEYVPFPIGVGPQGEQGPQGDPGPSGAGITLFPAPYVSAAWAGRVLAGGALVDVPALFGCPSAPAYLVWLSGLATAAGVVVRAGSEGAPYFLTLMTQVADIRMDCQGWIPGPVCWVSVLGSASVWLQIAGIG